MTKSQLKIKKSTVLNPTELDRLIEFGDSIVKAIFETKINYIDQYKTYYRKERDYIIKNFKHVPRFLKKYRTYDSLITYLISIDNDLDTWKQSARIYVNDKFSDFLNYLEFGDNLICNEILNKSSCISIVLRKEIFSHVQKLLNDKHYFNAVEESYKIVREKLKSITGKEKAHEAFSKNNYIIIFGHEAVDEAEKDFFEGVKFLHLAIQKLRNEKSHTPANKMERNLAIHYIVLASLAYDLISRE